jgi:organic hydroperoxide reductase OsmC/OhrA
MQELPHHYAVTAAGGVVGEVELATDRLPRLRSASPTEFDGPGDQWSPETFLVGAVADCIHMEPLVDVAAEPVEALTGSH